MIIEKKQTNIDNCSLKWQFFTAAREALEYVLSHEIRGKKILIPAYIGYSTREGSGVFDPIRSTGTKYDFYSLDETLNIDIDNITKKMIENKSEALLLIHYFGFKDRNIETIKKLAEQNRMLIIEDFAHAFYSFWMNPRIDFDYGIFSHHKMFPVDNGGALLSSRPIERNNDFVFNFFSYDISSIIQKRFNNFRIILKTLKKYSNKYSIEILRNKINDCVPQTFPILVKNQELRDLLYFELNNKGYGAVSLYHELISQIPDTYKREMDISKRILNLPVHQDVDRASLAAMLREMIAIIKKY